MVDPTLPWIGGPLMVVLLAASAYFSSTEIAVFSLPAEWITTRGVGAGLAGRTLADLRADPHRLLVTLLVGNTLVNVAFSAITTVAIASVLPSGQAAVVATLLASTLILVFGEILPKSFGLGNAERWALFAARPLAAIELLLYPVVLVFDVVTRRIGSHFGGAKTIEEPYTR